MEPRSTGGSMKAVRVLRDALDDMIETHERYRGVDGRLEGARRALDAYRSALGPDARGDRLLVTLQGETERLEEELSDLRQRQERARREVERHAGQMPWDSLPALSDAAPRTAVAQSGEVEDGGETADDRGASEDLAGECVEVPDETEVDQSTDRRSPRGSGSAGEGEGTGSLWAQILREEADDEGFRPGAARGP